MAQPGPTGGGHYRGRFAPSPTGFLHLGNARTALVAWLRARSFGGDFVIRVEDLDGPRTKPEAVSGNLSELRWLGLDWEEGPDVGGPHGPYRQSERSALYAAALERLRADDRVFECYLSRKDLAEASGAPHGPAHTRVYSDADRRRSAAIASIKLAAGATPSWRFAVTDEEVSFADACLGETRVRLARDFGHFVVRRADGLWAYQLAVVVDDAAMEVTEVVRGADLLTSTAAQLALYEALALEPPGFAHVGLLQDVAGERLAKRSGALALTELRTAGVRPERVLGLLGHLLGVTEARTELSPAELLAAFDPARHSCDPARLTPADLGWLTAG